MYDIIIIGGGPAGLTAGIYGVRANKKVLVIESTACGGQIINTSHIDNYPVAPHITGIEFGQTLEKQARDLGVEIEFDTVTSSSKDSDSFTVVAEDDSYSGKSVIIATGTQPRKLGLTNEDDFVGRGISYCATCDGKFYEHKTVAVNGGGNSALHEALYLSNIASKVYLIHRRDEFRGSDSLVDKVKSKDNIELVLNSTIVELLGDGKLQSIKLDDGRTIEIDGLFVSIGRMPNAATLCTGLALADGDYVSASDDCKTNIDGLFVAGDVRAKEIRQLVTATADGAIAATMAIQYLG